jgi:cytochrome c553
VRIEKPECSGRTRSDARARAVSHWVGALLLIALGAWLSGPGLRLAKASSEGPNPSAPTPTRPGLMMPRDLSPSVRAALEREGDVVRGQDAYTTCAVCHMSSGGGHSDGTFPQLAGQHASVIIKQLIDIREGRRANPLMLPFANRLSGSQEVADVALYLSLLPEAAENGKGTGQDLLLGAELYGRDCTSCHGARGEGDAARLIPVLAGQHYGYMLRQIRNIGAGRRGNAHPEMVSLAAGYSDAELMALVDYASRIRDADRKE